MRYETPRLLLVGSASSLVLGVQPWGKVDRWPEPDFRKGDKDDIPEGLDE